MKLNLGLDNNTLYNGCEIIEVGGRKTLVTDVQLATNIIGRNTQELIESESNRDEIVLTGAMAVWAYLIIFHIVVHKFKKVYYDDGRSGQILISQH
jgi:hypothetical protein